MVHCASIFVERFTYSVLSESEENTNSNVNSLRKETINNEIRAAIRRGKGTIRIQKLDRELEWRNPQLGKQHMHGPLRHYLRRDLFGIKRIRTKYAFDDSLWEMINVTLQWLAG